MDEYEYDDTEVMSNRAVRNVLDAHGVRSMEATDGTILAWYEATQRTEAGTIVDASDWEALPAPVTERSLAHWLGY